MWELPIFALGLAGLWVGTEFVIPATIDLGRRHGVSPAVLGLTVLAIGTDLPELLVAINGGLQQLRGVDASGVVIGNAIGSALTQCTLVLGLATWARSGRFPSNLAPRDGVALVLAIALLATVAVDGRIGFADGAVLVLGYVAYLTIVIRGRRQDDDVAVGRTPRATRTLSGIGGGLLLILFSAELVVSNGLLLAERWGVDQGLVGILLIGLGTSLPELALSFDAARRGHTTLSVANLVGSNVFDLLVPIGASALIHPLDVGRATLLLDLPATALAHVFALGLLRSRVPGALAALILVGLYSGFALGRVALDG